MTSSCFLRSLLGLILHLIVIILFEIVFRIKLPFVSRQTSSDGQKSYLGGRAFEISRSSLKQVSSNNVQFRRYLRGWMKTGHLVCTFDRCIGTRTRGKKRNEKKKRRFGNDKLCINVGCTRVEAGNNFRFFLQQISGERRGSSLCYRLPNRLFSLSRFSASAQCSLCLQTDCRRFRRRPSCHSMLTIEIFDCF